MPRAGEGYAGSRSAGAFRKGLLQLVSPGWLRVFSSRDLNDLLSGPGHSDIDVDDLRRYFSAAATTHMNTPPEMWLGA